MLFRHFPLSQKPGSGIFLRYLPTFTKDAIRYLKILFDKLVDYVIGTHKSYFL
jgi:hypothetical protein